MQISVKKIVQPDDFLPTFKLIFNIQPCFQQFVERKTVGNTILFPTFHNLQKYFPLVCEKHGSFSCFQLVVENRVEIFLKAVDNEKMYIQTGFADTTNTQTTVR